MKILETLKTNKAEVLLVSVLVLVFLSPIVEELAAGRFVLAIVSLPIIISAMLYASISYLRNAIAMIIAIWIPRQLAGWHGMAADFVWFVVCACGLYAPRSYLSRKEGRSQPHRICNHRLSGVGCNVERCLLGNLCHEPRGL